MSPLLEASPVTIKGDSRGDLLGVSDHVKGLSEGPGPHAVLLVRVTFLAEEHRRSPSDGMRPGHTLGLPYHTPRFHGK